MSKPKDKRNEWNRQHKRILEDRDELLTKLETYDLQKVKDIELTLAPVQAELEHTKELLRAANARAERFLASNKLLERDLDIERGRVQGVIGVLGLVRSEKAELETKLAEHAPTLARLEELIDRWAGRARKAELEEARALLNRKALAQAVPGVNRG